MGAETTHRTRKAILDAVRMRAIEVLDSSIEAAKDANPFLNGVPATLEALRSGRIESRVYDRDKFHAKAYITHAKLEVVGSQALVGSSNFSAPGLTKNIELNVQIQSAREVAQLVMPSSTRTRYRRSGALGARGRSPPLADTIDPSRRRDPKRAGAHPRLL
jgi:phosphatidylserine/phosphatidylglycerophosphate/cardiolipin synthase-like enzyme